MIYNYGKSLYEYCKKNNIGNASIINNFYHISFSEEEIKLLYKKGCVYIANEGGLVLGKSHLEGGVFLIAKKEKRFHFKVEIEGFEFLSGSIEDELHEKYLKMINDSTQHIVELEDYHLRQFPIDLEKHKDCPIIDTSKAEIAFIIIDEPRYIINRAATQKYINQLIRDSLFIKRRNKY